MDRRPVNRTARIRIDRNLSGTHAVPDWNDTERNRPISRVLPDRGIAVIHQLVAVVFELLPKVIEHRPGLMAGGTAEAVLTGESREGVRTLSGTENQKDQDQRAIRKCCPCSEVRRRRDCVALRMPNPSGDRF